MPKFIDPSGHSNFGLGLCARCSRKFPLDELYSDPNSPGLKVCVDDLDEYDPYRLPARRTETISLPFTRPDVPLTAGGPSPNINSLFGLRTTGFAIRGTMDGERRIMIPPLPDEVTS